ncbi:hypothetical protein MTO96_051565 [Rhipicephalus appendiculatus]
MVDSQLGPVDFVGACNVHVEHKEFVGPLRVMLARGTHTNQLEVDWFRQLGIVMTGFSQVDKLMDQHFCQSSLSELTSKITLKQPGDRIDTLPKLEAALDRFEVAPCCAANSAIHEQLARGTQPESSLMSKLQAAFKRRGADELVKRDFSECLRCALRPDRVCYGTFEHACNRAKQIAGVRLLKENYKMSLSGFRMPKSLPLYRPLRRFFRALKEGKLIDEDYSECDRVIAASTVEFDLSGFFAQYAVLQTFCCVALAVEIMVARLQGTRRAK